jgi:serine protease
MRTTQVKNLRKTIMVPLMMALFGVPESVIAKKWIVKMKQPGGFLPQELRSQVRAYQTRSLASELESQTENIRAKSTLDQLGIAVVTSTDEDQVRSILLNHPDVEYFEPNIEYRLQTTPSDQSLSPWMSDVMGLTESEPDYQLSYIGSSPVIVGVVDTGATIGHPYLTSALAVNSVELAGTTGVDDDANGYIDDIYGGNAILKTGNVTEDSTDHGSHVAGLVKAIRDQAIGDFPEARAVQILPIRFIDQSGVGSTAGALEAIAYAISRGVKVLNASWGARGEEAFSQALYDAMAELYLTHDVLITVAAGNSEGNGPNNNDVIPYFPSGFNIPGLLSVASVTPEYSFTGVGTNTRMSGISFSDFSNYGSRTVHLAAPGSFRNAQFDSSGVYSMNAHYTSASNYYIRKKGTSMAAPVVAGVAAVVRAINPSLTAYEAGQILLNTSSVSDVAEEKTISGGIVSAIDAFNAAENAISTGLQPEVTGDAFYTYEEETSTSVSDGGTRATSSGGGCGTISSQNDSNSQGPSPLGGNSIFLITGIYFLFLASRKVLRSITKP